jgi:hypothetical protein
MEIIFTLGFISVLLLGPAIGAQLGKLKGRPFAGGMLGLALGPIGWLIVLIGPNLLPKCKACGGVIVKGVSKCKHCGSSIGFDEQTYLRQKAQLKTRMASANSGKEPRSIQVRRN